ncbi:hypothetical protein CROQUDRAFT_688115 [Cronartium quercuum f. sp. fusiforme G11]|uniref:Uncharacterized protein n=1 Tax=Cronartium quercuum f. sp. fusiforme G11 TaxID=708437 RepID=A0A9P6T7X9_9BASI|nr:hypothetical protein CROQUDRAFT_688115 [Cronartium quercuum f. sp. fusiforme G11]
MSPSEKVPLLGTIHSDVEGSSLAKIPAHGWISFANGFEYLEDHPSLTKYHEAQVIDGQKSGWTQEENMARWALSQAPQENAVRKFLVRQVDHNELFNAMVWLIGHAEGDWKAWKRVAAGWKDVPVPDVESHTRLPKLLDPPPERLGFFLPDAVAKFGWLTKARNERNIPSYASDITAISGHLGWLLSGTRKMDPPVGVVFKKESTDGPFKFIERVRSFLSGFSSSSHPYME